MSSMLRVLSAERLKMSRSYMVLLMFISPILAFIIGLLSEVGDTPQPWIALLGSLSMLHAMLFMPIMSGIFAAFICRYEHAGGGWKQLLVLPVTRTGVYVAKFTVIALLLAMMQLLFLAAIVILGFIKGIHDPFPWDIFARSIIGGWVACLPLAALQLAVSLMWNSFAAPLALNVMLTIPNMLVINSATYGPYYPWAQPFLATLPGESTIYGNDPFGAFNLPFESLMITVVGSFIVFFTAGWLYFRRKEV
ncbi:ABC transporter permease [Paenibacillus pini]|uniref:Uncharacterized protein n=1 Tax=Paenibacillus pini JCM 16418 TaxID=1236976 RepID=W7YN34_9BACL|nr:ABC transporter permease [Paenibacillus pini]GAF09872.1 hypothetical protein JCM16418_4032 [Paenibacillus pini JCM 16418]